MPQWIDTGWSARRLVNGALAGIAGGVVFGVMMQMMGMMAAVGRVIGTTDLTLAWLYHLFNSVVFGAILALVARPSSYLVGAVDGLVWGLVLWVVAATLIMRTILGMPISFVDQPALMSLVGHVVYGVLTGLTLAALNRRAATPERVRGRTAV